MSLLPWQNELWNHVIKLAKRNAMPHAFLFTGIEGVGKGDFANELAAYLLCEKNRDLNSVVDKPCGECKQCKLFQAETHPDFKLVQPEEGSVVLKIDRIRSLVEFFNQSSMQGGRKVTIVSPAESLNHNAANALLKTLEEPTPNSVIILIAHNSGQLLPTIRSRCQVLDFSLPPVDQAREWLLSTVVMGSEKGYDEKGIDSVLRLASYAPLRAAQYLEVGALDENHKMLDELGSLLKNECLATALAERWNDDISTLRLSWTIHWIEQIVRIKMIGDVREVAETHGIKMMGYLAERCTEKQLFVLYQQSLKEYKLFLGTSNPNRPLSFEYLLHQWSGLMIRKQ